MTIAQLLMLVVDDVVWLWRTLCVVLVVMLEDDDGLLWMDDTSFRLSQILMMGCYS